MEELDVSLFNLPRRFCLFPCLVIFGMIGTSSIYLFISTRNIKQTCGLPMGRGGLESRAVGSVRGLLFQGLAVGRVHHVVMWQSGAPTSFPDMFTLGGRCQKGVGPGFGEVQSVLRLFPRWWGFQASRECEGSKCSNCRFQRFHSWIPAWGRGRVQRQKCCNPF